MITNKVIHKVRLQFISPTKLNWRNAALLITKGCVTPYDKARAIYSWLIDNISYDTSLKIHDADEAWKKGKGVCQAYCEIFYRLGLAVGLDVRIVSGLDKDVTGQVKPDGAHGWIVVNKTGNIIRENLMPENVIYEEGHEEQSKFRQTRGLDRYSAIMIEPTWGAGKCKNGKFIRSNHDMSWFDVKPETFVFTHFPDNPMDQLLGNYCITRNEFGRLPHISPEIIRYGFDSKDMLCYFLNNKSAKFPLVYDGFSDFVEFEEFPLTDTLYRGTSYTFRVIKKKNCTLALTNNGDFETDDAPSTHWEVYDNKYCIQVSFTDPGKARLMIQTDVVGNERIFSSIIEYYVI